MSSEKLLKAIRDIWHALPIPKQRFKAGFNINTRGIMGIVRSVEGNAFPIGDD